ncbi:MAG: hypothetical protein H0V65_04155 [Chitinophagales bacterium]|jgi:hypothetical protein|nr:hypothetical protein [Chitinophagales bacterium]
MKKIAFYLTLFIGLTTISQSCKKDTTNDPVTQTITETIRVNQSYQFDLGSFGDEEGASISKQANHFSISSVDREVNTGKVIYKYTPATNFVGTDEVEIKSARGSNGSSPNNKIILTTMKFTVTN